MMNTLNKNIEYDDFIAWKKLPISKHLLEVLELLINAECMAWASKQHKHEDPVKGVESDNQALGRIEGYRNLGTMIVKNSLPGVSKAKEED